MLLRIYSGMGCPMTIEANKAVMHRFTEFVNTANEKLATELIAPDAIFHVPGLSEPLRGPGGYVAIIRMMRVGFPDIPVGAGGHGCGGGQGSRTVHVTGHTPRCLLRCPADREDNRGAEHGLLPSVRRATCRRTWPGRHAWAASANRCGVISCLRTKQGTTPDPRLRFYLTKVNDLLSTIYGTFPSVRCFPTF